MSNDILQRITAVKREEIMIAKRTISLAELETRAKAEPQARDFLGALRNAYRRDNASLIAEIKRASPSKGIIREDFHPAELAKAYEIGGAACLSVLTDRDFFQGDNAFLQTVRSVTTLPALRKDFMLDPYQIVESRALGADCILLIAACLSDAQMAELEATAFALGMDVLAEVHDRAEAERTLAVLQTPMIGINNRNLKTFHTDIGITENLAPLIVAARPDAFVISESGITEKADIDRLTESGEVKGFLVGESLMRHADVTAAVRKLLLG